MGNIRDLTVCRRDTALPREQPLVLPVRDLADWEALEGMRVHSHTRLLVADLFGSGYGLGNYGKLVVSSSL
ncbi:hypothetical protein Q8W27_17015, partial [Oceanobacter sp. 2_MG-2023]|uniref:hypothetical protein n=1 Tax=Oceanobacter sp. 2_MG-2023 TaxID=3062619 RepID=UPI002734ED6F